MIQAHALDAIFNTLALRASRADRMDHFDRYLPLGLKAQSQCRATLEILVFAREANIAQGPQQVNNAMMPAGAPRAGGKNENTPNELLEEKPHERLDTRTTSPASGADPQLATVGGSDRTAHGGKRAIRT